jgi:hypothetical protein
MIFPRSASPSASDTGKMYIKGYLYPKYPISQIFQKGYFLSLFEAGYFEDIISYF